MGSLDSAPESSQACPLACPRAGQRRVCSSSWVFLSGLGMSPSPSRVSALPTLTPHRSSALDLGQPQPGRRLDGLTDHGTQRRPIQGWRLDGAAVAIVGASPNTRQESTWAPPALQCGCLERACWRLGAVVSCEGQRGLAPKAASEWSKESNCRSLHRQHIRDSPDLCLWLT